MSVFRAGARALITGAGSGVGLAVTKLCVKHGMSVVMVDVDRQRLETASSAIKSSSTNASLEIHDMDVSSLPAWTKLSNKLSKTPLDLLMLNAGIGLKGTWTDNDYFHRIFDVNFFGVVNGVNAFFPQFATPAQERKAIIITGSKQGITNPPGNAAYNASKSAVKTLAEHLSYDLKEQSNVSVHLLVPGWTFTGLTGGGTTKEKPEGAWEPSQVADYLYQKMEDGKFYVICPDNDVSTETDRKRMMWSVGDIVYERKPLSRWRGEYKDEAAKTMENMKL